jgi:large subunit ribosomal protein L10e
MGDTKASYEYRVSLISEAPIQIRHNALEAARVAANKVLLDKLGETGYVVRLRPYPHIILRENRMIATAGADRLQEGMRRAFGKPSGRAARIRSGQPILDLYVNQSHVDLAKEALKVSSSKLAASCRIAVERAVPQPTA